jgi:hypothetical protein
VYTLPLITVADSSEWARDDAVHGRKALFQLSPQIILYHYTEVLTFIDQFMALRFTATGAPPAARRIRILPMDQYA